MSSGGDLKEKRQRGGLSPLRMPGCECSDADTLLLAVVDFWLPDCRRESNRGGKWGQL